MSRGLSNDFVEQVRESANFEELATQHCQQVRRVNAHQLLALCPFHQEKTPSFHINLDLNRYYCFGCKAKGDVFSFTMEMQRMDFPEAVRFLAQRCGIPEPEESHYSPEEKVQVKARREKKDRFYDLHAEFAKWYMQILRSYPDSAVHQYFLTRQLPWEVADRFMIGAAPDSWDAGMRFGRSLGFTEDELLEAGILIRNEERDTVYDRFRNRLVFPIWDEAGRVVGFSARTVERDHKGAKYVNSPETPIFKKGNILYALPLARDGIKRCRTAILCEGQLDSIAMHRGGWDCAVAPQGTGFTQEQAKLLSRYTKQVHLCFDADGAGRKATVAALEHLLPLDFEVRAVCIEGGKDPDEILKAEGPDGITRLMNHSVELPDILFNFLKQEVDLNSPFGKDEAVNQLEHYFGMLTSPVVRDQYWQQAAARLELKSEVLFAQLRKLRMLAQARSHAVRTGAAPIPAPQPEVPQGGTSPSTRRRGASDAIPGMIAHATRTLLELALQDENLARRVMEAIPHQVLDTLAAGRALNWLGDLSLNGEWAELSHRVDEMIQSCEDADGLLARAVVTGSTLDEAQRERAIEDCIQSLRQYALKTRKEELRTELAAARGTPREAELFDEYSKLR